jgi:hypothetical protein
MNNYIIVKNDHGIRTVILENLRWDIAKKTVRFLNKNCNFNDIGFFIHTKN